MKASCTLIWCIACLTSCTAYSLRPVMEEEQMTDVTEEACMPCEMLFRKLESTGKGEKMTQRVTIQLRGEPKSGTGMSADWATGALYRTCDYLNRLFGENSCQLHMTEGHIHNRERIMTFEPARAVGRARCSCNTVERVTIDLSDRGKHGLPLDRRCSYNHRGTIDNVRDAGRKDACRFANGTRIQNHSDLWHCMEEANCKMLDDRLQMAVFRDPRPVAVSAYYHLALHHKRPKGPMEAFAAEQLTLMCQWVALRYILFSGFLHHQSEQFWYTDAIADPLAWHYRWFDFAGLQLPASEVKATAAAAARNDFSFPYKHIDEHPGQAEHATSVVRNFADQVSPEMREAAKHVMHQWLPPVLLAKLDV